jgi:ribosomal protein S18 acetylase RimI-like enzyme
MYFSSKLTLRPVGPQDDHLLKTIYGWTRSEELNLAKEWSEQMKDSFITHQYYAQKDYYQRIYPQADYSIIVYENENAGRLYVERKSIENNIRIIDISLLPSFRNKGIGTHLINQLQEEAKTKDQILSIHVEKFNKALDLYQKLGFEIIKETNGVYYLMHWKHQ